MQFSLPSGRWTLLALGVALVVSHYFGGRTLVPGLIMIVVAGGLFARRAWALRRERHLRRHGRRIDATFVEVRRGDSDDGGGYWILAEHFDPASQRYLTYHSERLADDPSYAIPDAPIGVLVDPQDPARYLMELPFLARGGKSRRAATRIDRPSPENEQSPVVFLVIGTIVAASFAWFKSAWLGVVVFAAVIVGASWNERLRRRGLGARVEVVATVREVTTRLDETCAGRATYRIVAAGIDPVSRRLRTFYSTGLAADPGAFAAPGTPVRVLLAPRRPEKYTMDLAFLPDIVLADRGSEFARFARFIPWYAPAALGALVIAIGAAIAPPWWIGIGIGTFIALLAPPMFLQVRRDAQRLWRRRTFGHRIEATVLGVGRDTTLTVNGENPWRVFAQWHDAERNRLVVFGTDSFWERPEWLRAGETVTVTVDPDEVRNFELQVPTTTPLRKRKQQGPVPID